MLAFLSDLQFQAANLELIEKVLRENFYPEKFVKDNIKHRRDILTQRERNATNHRTQNVEVKPFVSIPYIEQLSEKIAGILKRHNISTAYRNTRDLSTVLKPVKDKLEKNEQCNVVYSIPCKGNNCQAAYIGQKQKDR